MRTVSLMKGEETAIPIKQPFRRTPEPHFPMSFQMEIQFKSCYIFRFGGVDDEVLNGHPLYDHGLEYYEMHEIIHSSWIREQEKRNSVHPNYKKEFWNYWEHYLYTFHDEIFECIAKGYNEKVYNGKLNHIPYYAPPFRLTAER